MANYKCLKERNFELEGGWGGGVDLKFCSTKIGFDYSVGKVCEWGGNCKYL
jgi:hypothetical protein